MEVAYRREIDGLRALAVLPVIFFHAGFERFAGGFVGVDVFFVISGYLITSIILAEIKAGTFSIGTFYERRARRILPALFLVMAVCVPIATLLLLPQDLQDFAESVAAVSVFSSNILFTLESGYFDAAAEQKPLLHTWSLAVEEQFYLVFPLLLLVVWKYGHRHQARIFLAIAILSLVFAQRSVNAEHAGAFYLLPARGWELLIGCLIAFRFPPGSRPNWPTIAAESLSVVGIGMLLYAIFFFDKNTPFPGGFALVPTIGTALLIIFASPDTTVGKILGNRLFVGLGLVSYSAYLWHQPLIAFARYRNLTEPSPATMLVLCALSLLLAYLSWRFVERPFRRKGRFSRKQVAVMAVGLTAAFVSIGLVGHMTSGLERRFIAQLDERQLKVYAAGGPREGNLQAMIDDGNCRFHVQELSEPKLVRFRQCSARYGKAVVVLGDSHAMDVFNAIARTSDKEFVLGLSKPGCRPHAVKRHCNLAAFVAFLEENQRNIETVYYTQAGFYLLQDADGTPGSRDFFRKKHPPVYASNDEYVNRVIDYLKSIPPEIDLVWVGPRIEPHLNVSQMKKVALRCPAERPQVDPNITETFVRLDRYLSSRSSRAGIDYLSSVEALAFRAEEDLFDCGSVYWSDSDHWSPAGERRFGQRLVAHLASRGTAALGGRSSPARWRGAGSTHEPVRAPASSFRTAAAGAV